MPLDSEIIVVSGLPRSGTSLMMQMLDRGGIPALTDEQRTPDPDNPRGYYEFEPVKGTKRDSSWLLAARGKVVKLVSALLYDLPPTERYRVIFMQRDLGEVLRSQEKMLQRRNQPVPDAGKMRSAFTVHLERLFAWLPAQGHMQILTVSYNDLMSDAPREAARIAEFLGGRPDPQGMLQAIDPDLYRNRSAVPCSSKP
jgi:sulfotransferase family protein